MFTTHVEFPWQPEVVFINVFTSVFDIYVFDTAAVGGVYEKLVEHILLRSP
jgi:hypothetical protein